MGRNPGHLPKPIFWSYMPLVLGENCLKKLKITSGGVLFFHFFFFFILRRMGQNKKIKIMVTTLPRIFIHIGIAHQCNSIVLANPALSSVVYPSLPVVGTAQAVPPAVPTGGHRYFTSSASCRSLFHTRMREYVDPSIVFGKIL